MFTSRRDYLYSRPTSHRPLDRTHLSIGANVWSCINYIPYVETCPGDTSRTRSAYHLLTKPGTCMITRPHSVDQNRETWCRSFRYFRPAPWKSGDITQIHQNGACTLQRCLICPMFHFAKRGRTNFLIEKQKLWHLNI